MRYRLLTASLAALTMFAACDRTPTESTRTTGPIQFDQGPGGGGGLGGISLGGTWTGSFSPTISAPQVVTFSLNQSRQSITGTATFALASDTTQKVVDTVVGLVSGNFVDLHFTSVATGVTQLNYAATVSSLDKGGAALEGNVNLIDPFQIIGSLSLVRR